MKIRYYAPFSLFFLFHTFISGEESKHKVAQNQKHRLERPAFKAWKLIDANNDGVVSYEEFIQLERLSRIPAYKQKMIFERLDKNANSMIEPNELAVMAKHEGHPPMIPNLQEIDTNQDAQVSFEEFVKSSVVSRFPEERQRVIFQKLDRDGDGFLSPKDRPDDMRKRPFPPRRDGVLDKEENREPRHPMRDLQHVWKEVDTNNDDKLNFAEFQNVPMIKHMGEDAQENRFELIDKDDDSYISRDEWQQQPKPDFPTRQERNSRRAESPEKEIPKPKEMIQE